ncbi:hypothetical protein Slin15195_G066450 [Septoria linicola]|uniref:Uncharacterized protein n=1 Tax=Septoria linicola TaxID=215465 RepID=A0A9Q9EJ10_9PEZI|nr:hypothetical protein Slin15195_G066450 [Septoria linicola]
MDQECPRGEHLSPLVESSKMAEQRAEHERLSAVARPSNSKAPVDASPARSMKRADSKISNTSDPASPTSKDNGSSSAETTSYNDGTASMHSDQSFDLGYKGRPARPCVNKSHMRVWNSMYTRPLGEMLREILEVRYPLPAEGEDERSPLLGLGLRRSNYGWLCGLRRSWRVRLRREGET